MHAEPDRTISYSGGEPDFSRRLRNPRIRYIDNAGDRTRDNIASARYRRYHSCCTCADSGDAEIGKPSIPKKPQVAVLEAVDFAQAKNLHMQALIRSGAKPLALTEVGYYMDVQNAQFIQQLRATDIDIRHEGDLIVLTLPGGDSFDPNSTRLKPGAIRNLALAAQVLTEYAQTQITIHGHTDDTGEAKYNQWLSVRRALSVTDQLLKAGVATRRIAVVGFGENSPLVPNTTADGRARNRRIELYLEPIAR